MWRSISHHCSSQDCNVLVKWKWLWTKDLSYIALVIFVFESSTAISTLAYKTNLIRKRYSHIMPKLQGNQDIIYNYGRFPKFYSKWLFYIVLPYSGYNPSQSCLFNPLRNLSTAEAIILLNLFILWDMSIGTGSHFALFQTPP